MTSEVKEQETEIMPECQNDMFDDYIVVIYPDLDPSSSNKGKVT